MIRGIIKIKGKERTKELYQDKDGWKGKRRKITTASLSLNDDKLKVESKKTSYKLNQGLRLFF